MRIYTRTGDNGMTSLIGGKRVKKYDIRLEAYGTIDELNSCIGLILSTNEEKEILNEIQNMLFNIGAWLADGTGQRPDDSCIEEGLKQLENEIDRLSELLPTLKSFVMPGGNIGASFAHLARTVCRRAERRIIELADKEIINQNLIKYINRLSDYLFVLARMINHERNFPENFWITNKRKNNS